MCVSIYTAKLIFLFILHWTQLFPTYNAYLATEFDLDYSIAQVGAFYWSTEAVEYIFVASVKAALTRLS